MASEGAAGAPQPAQMNWARVALDTFNAEHGSSFTIEPSNVYDQTRLAGARGETPGRRSGRRRSRRTRLVVGHRDRGTDLRCRRPRLRLAVGHRRLADRRTSQALLPGRREQRQASRRPSFDWSRRRCIRRPSSSWTTARSTRPTSPRSSSTASRRTTPTLDRASVDVGQPDYSDVVAKIGPSTNVVVMPFVNPNDAQRLADQIHAAGKDPTIVGGDVMFSLNDFNVPGAYVPTYAPDVSKMADGAATVKLYSEIFGDLAPFAATAYVAMQTVATAALDSCRERSSHPSGSRRSPARRQDPVHSARELRLLRCPSRAHRQPLLDVPDRRRELPAHPVTRRPTPLPEKLSSPCRAETRG